MAIIHKTTMTPGKLELLASWLPARPWYAAGRGAPEPVKAGGFRLDDPAGEVGMEFMVVTVGPAAYHVPLTYRGAPLEGADSFLLGTSEHGVLGQRWIYDGTHDPILLARLLALLQEDAEPQAQSVNDTSDPTVNASFTGPVRRTPAGEATVDHGAAGTDVTLPTRDDDGRTGTATIHVAHALRPDSAPSGSLGQVTATWRRPDATEQRSVFATLD